MTERTGYKSRVTTVRGRARAHLAAIRKDRLARKRAASGTRDAIRDDVRTGGIAATEAVRDAGLVAKVAAAVPDGYGPDAEPAAEPGPARGAGASDLIEPPAAQAGEAAGAPRNDVGREGAEPAALPSTPEEASGDAEGGASFAPCHGADVADAVPEAVMPPDSDAGPAEPEPAFPADEGALADRAEYGPAGAGSDCAAEHGSGDQTEPQRDESVLRTVLAPEQACEAAPGTPEHDGPAPRDDDPGAEVPTAFASAADTAPPGAEETDLYRIPGIGSGLVWMFKSAGITTLAELAQADSRHLGDRLGVIARLLDLDFFVAEARSRMSPDGRG